MPYTEQEIQHRMTPEEIAMEIMESEDMMWLMCGGDSMWIPTHLSALRPAWDAYIEAGGKTYGR